MADRGFKFFDTLLFAQNCTLIRPPSVSAQIKQTKKQVIETRRIASFRIHIERVIEWIRYFEMFKPHACIPIENVDLLDSMLKIACGLLNLHSCLIRQ